MNIEIRISPDDWLSYISLALMIYVCGFGVMHGFVHGFSFADILATPTEGIQWYWVGAALFATNLFTFAIELARKAVCR